MSFLDCHWILLRHLEFKKIQGKKQTLQSVEKLSFSFVLLFHFHIVFYHIFSIFKKYFYTYSVIGKSILDEMNTTLLKICRPKFFFYIKLHTMLHVTTLRDFVMKFKPCTAKFLFCSICIYIWVYVYYFSIQ